MSREAREVVADWLMVIGAVLLAVSLFLPWSHQFSPGYATAFAASGALVGIPASPTAWQVYSAADVLLALLALSIFLLALLGPRRPRIIAAGLIVLALAFVIHALSAPPTNGAGLAAPPASAGAGPGTAAPAPVAAPAGVLDHPSSGAGEVLALIALVVCGGGLALSLTAD
jgi:hypothetical protein